MCDLADANPDQLEVFIVRPGGILPVGAGFMKTAGKLYSSIDVNHLANAMIGIISDGHDDRVIENEILLAM